MKSSVIIFLIIGLLIGSSAGYLVTDNQLRPQIEELTIEVEQGNDLIENLTQDNSILVDKFESLEEENNRLKLNYDSLNQDFLDLSSQFNQLEDDYVELLEDYEEIVATLPIEISERESSESIEREYHWNYNGRNFDISLSIPETLYTYYQEKDRAYSEDYSIYVTHPSDDEYIDTIIKKFNFIALDYGYTESQKIDLVIAFVQSLPYTFDDVSTPYDEYPRYPLETLVDNGGDCEDTSILTASLLTAMNYDLILIAPPEHLAVGINIDAYGSYWTYDEKQYFYLETTGEGWQIGEYPGDLEETAFLYPLNPIAICTHNWVAKWKGESKIEVTITVVNEGTALAEDINVYASFDAGEGYIWSEKESDFFNLGPGNSITKTLLLDVPKNEHTRLIVGVGDAEGYYLDQSYSEWFDT